MKRVLIDISETVEVSIIPGNDVYQLAVLIDGEIIHNEVYGNLNLKEMLEVMDMIKDKYSHCIFPNQETSI